MCNKTADGNIVSSQSRAIAMTNKKSIHMNMKMSNAGATNAMNDSMRRDKGMQQDTLRSRQQTQNIALTMNNQFRPQLDNTTPSDDNAMVGFIRTPYGWYRDMSFFHNTNGNGAQTVRGPSFNHFYGSHQHQHQHPSLNLPPTFLPIAPPRPPPPIKTSPHTHSIAASIPVKAKAQASRRKSTGSAATAASVPDLIVKGPNHHNNYNRGSNPPRKMFFYRHTNHQSSNTGHPGSSVSDPPSLADKTLVSSNSHRHIALAHPVPRYVSGSSVANQPSPHALSDITNQESGAVAKEKEEKANETPKSNSQAHVNARNINGGHQIQVDTGNHRNPHKGSISCDTRYTNTNNVIHPVGSITATSAKRIDQASLLTSPSSLVSATITAKRSVDDLYSISSSSSWSSSVIATTDAPDQKMKRRRACSSGQEVGDTGILPQDSTTMAKHPSPTSCPRGMLDLLCEATAIVSKRMETVPRKPAPSTQTEPNGSIRREHNLGHGKKAETSKEKAVTGSRSPGVVSRSPTPISSMVLSKPRSCNCPRSRCIKLYCECFQAGKFCTDKCQCKKCKNTEEENGPGGARTRAIQNILSRNPHAFQKKKQNFEKMDSDSVGVNCRCVKSQCLKLYCDCFQSGKVCGEFCMCVNCLNTIEESGADGKRTIARSICLLRKPNAFKKKVKVVGGGCSCKNSKCLKKYCACFDAGLACSPKCSCRDCQNIAPKELKAMNALMSQQSTIHDQPSNLHFSN